jgi:hypothetical protein
VGVGGYGDVGLGSFSASNITHKLFKKTNKVYFKNVLLLPALSVPIPSEVVLLHLGWSVFALEKDP